MTAMERPDVFKGVHKGLRKALFDLAVQAGATDASRADEGAALAAKAKEVFHFVEHHAWNEDRFLEPMMAAKGMPEADRMRIDHERLEAEVSALAEAAGRLGQTPQWFHGFYLSLNRFIAEYLVHLHEEETAILPALHARFTDAELADFSRQSVAATAPADQEMMLTYMFPAMNAGELRDFFAGLQGKAPAEMVAHLRGIAERTTFFPTLDT